MVLAIYCTGADAPRVERYESEEATKGLGNGFLVFASMEKLAYSTKISGGLIWELYNSIVPDPEKKWVRVPSREEAAQQFWDLCHEVLPITAGLRPTTASGDAAPTEEGTMANATENTASSSVKKAATTAKKKTAAAAKKPATAPKADTKKKTTAPVTEKKETAAATEKKAATTSRGVKTDAPAGAGRGRASAHAGKKLYPVAAKCKEGNPRRAGTPGNKSMQIIIDNPGILFEDFIKKGGRSPDLNWDVAKGNASVK
jgi:hypothetical protein